MRTWRAMVMIGFAAGCGAEGRVLEERIATADQSLEARFAESPEGDLELALTVTDDGEAWTFRGIDDGASLVGRWDPCPPPMLQPAGPQTLAAAIGDPLQLELNERLTRAIVEQAGLEELADRAVQAIGTTWRDASIARTRSALCTDCRETQEPGDPLSKTTGPSDSKTSNGPAPDYMKP